MNFLLVKKLIYAPTACTSPTSESFGIVIASAITPAMAAGLFRYAGANLNESDDARSACADSSMWRSSIW